MKKIKCGLITSGGDAPGMNKLVFDLYYLFKNSDIELILIKNGLKGLYNKDIFEPCFDILHNLSFQHSSIIGTSRFPEFKDPEVRSKIKSNLKELGLDKLIIVGGDGSYEASKFLIDEISVIFIPATIDNDFINNHLTLGYYSSLEFISKTIFNISITAKCHQQIHMIELMGNKSSKLILNASSILNNVLMIDSLSLYNDDFKKIMIQRYKEQEHLIILVKEKIMDNAQRNILLSDISSTLNEKVRFTVLGYTQRACDVSLNDLIYSSYVSKYIVKNFESLNNIVVSYSFNDENNIRTSIIE